MVMLCGEQNVTGAESDEHVGAQQLESFVISSGNLVSVLKERQVFAHVQIVGWGIAPRTCAAAATAWFARGSASIALPA